MKAKLQAGFESFLSKRYATTVQIGDVPVRTYLVELNRYAVDGSSTK